MYLMEQFYSKTRENLSPDYLHNNLIVDLICFMDVGKLLISCQNCSIEGCFLGCRSSRNPFNYIYTTKCLPSRLYFFLALLNCKSDPRNLVCADITTSHIYMTTGSCAPFIPPIYLLQQITTSWGELR